MLTLYFVDLLKPHLAFRCFFDLKFHASLLFYLFGAPSLSVFPLSVVWVYGLYGYGIRTYSYRNSRAWSHLTVIRQHDYTIYIYCPCVNLYFFVY